MLPEEIVFTIVVFVFGIAIGYYLGSDMERDRMIRKLRFGAFDHQVGCPPMGPVKPPKAPRGGTGETR